MRTLVKILQRRSKRETNKVVAGRVEKVTTVGRVNVEEDTGDDDSLLLQQFLEECLRNKINCLIRK